jgi:hypothetical protein
LTDAREIGVLLLPACAFRLRRKNLFTAALVGPSAAVPKSIASISATLC